MARKNLLGLIAGIGLGLTSLVRADPVTNIEMNVTNNCTVDWIWGTQYMVNATSADVSRGNVSGNTNDWIDLGSNAVLSANVTDENSYFKRWNLDGGNYSTNNPLTLSVDKAYTNVVAEFKEKPTMNGARIDSNLSLGVTNLDIGQSYGLDEATNNTYPLIWNEKTNFTAVNESTNFNLSKDSERAFYRLKLK
jgi:hypothetical protein